MEFCKHQSLCGGCQYTHLTYSEEIAVKSLDLREKLKGLIQNPDIEILKLDGKGHRTRADITLKNGCLGFYKKLEKEVFPLETCQHWEPELLDVFQELKKFSWPFHQASFRIRVAGENFQRKGLWIDAANTDIKVLLEDEKLVHSLLAYFDRIEVGQKFKKLIFTDRARLQEVTADDPQSSWWSSYNQGLIELNGAIGSFTQPSPKYNELIFKWIETQLNHLQIKNIIEFGAGLGNLTLLFAGENRNVLSLESESALVEALKATLKKWPELEKRITLLQGDFHKTRVIESKLRPRLAQNSFELIFCNPPRSGSKDFAKVMADLNTPHFMYMSCFPESMAEDLKVFSSNDYQIKKVGIVDQFPRSKHYESLVLLSRVT